MISQQKNGRRLVWQARKNKRKLRRAKIKRIIGEVMAGIVFFGMIIVTGSALLSLSKGMI